MACYRYGGGGGGGGGGSYVIGEQTMLRGVQPMLAGASFPLLVGLGIAWHPSAADAAGRNVAPGAAAERLELVSAAEALLAQSVLTELQALRQAARQGEASSCGPSASDSAAAATALADVWEGAAVWPALAHCVSAADSSGDLLGPRHWCSGHA